MFKIINLFINLFQEKKKNLRLFNTYLIQIVKKILLIKYVKQIVISLNNQSLILIMEKLFGMQNGIRGNIIEINGDKIIFYRKNRFFNVKKGGNRVLYDNYNDWKLIQTWKGKKEHLYDHWLKTKDKQMKAWKFAEISENEKVLDVGFRDGYNLKFLKKKGVLIEGIDVNPFSVESANNIGCKAYQEDIQTKTHYEEGTFDVIIACDVLEHCFQPERALQEMHRILKDSGRILIEIPFEREFNRNLLHGHSFLFKDEKKFEDLVKSLNFLIIKKDTSNHKRNLFMLTKKKK